MKLFFAVLFGAITGSLSLTAQPMLRKALFLGNSYTYVNNLPGLTAALAHSSGDSLYFGSNTPGGYTLGWQPAAHCSDPVSLAAISSETWDFVILQEQSQTPAISRLRDSCMYPGSVMLNDSVKSANPCSRVLFYLTWGRRFGGIQCFTPNYCSPDFTGFNQMQDSLTLAYKRIADSLSGWIAPVGEAWRFVISNTGMVLHDADNSHPNLNGSYLAACVFYNVIFGKPSSGNSFTAGLAADTALFLQQAADSITFGYSAQWNLNNDEPIAAFSLTTSGDTVFTHNIGANATSWTWNDGNGQTSAQFEPYFVYPGPGTWTIKLRACNDCFCDSTQREATITTTGTSGSSGNDKTIRLVGPDHDGLIKISNFNETGTLLLYNISGNSPVILRVNAGHASTKPLGKSLWIWKLTNLSNETVARGKFIQ